MHRTAGVTNLDLMLIRRYPLAGFLQKSVVFKLNRTFTSFSGKQQHYDYEKKTKGRQDLRASLQGGCFKTYQQRRAIAEAPVYNFSVIVNIQNAFEAMHSFSNLPWWFLIMSSTIVLRSVITLPFARKQAQLLSQIELLKPTVDEISEALKHNLAVKGKRQGHTPEQVDKAFKKELRKYTYDLYQRNKCNPLKLLILPWIQLPIWISISLALRNLTGFAPGRATLQETFSIADGMTSEGLLWISNLVTPDPLWILPVILGLTNLANIELNILRKAQPATRDIIFTRVFRILTIGMIGVATQVPAAMSLYWTTSSTYGLLQNIVIRAPAVRRRLNIAKTPSESQTPYQDMWSVLKKRIDNFVKIQRIR